MLSFLHKNIYEKIEASISIRCLFLVMAAHDSSNNNKEKDATQLSHHHSPNNLRKILIVDDESDITSAFDMILEMNGFEVDTYNDPLLALSNFDTDHQRKIIKQK